MRNDRFELLALPHLQTLNEHVRELLQKDDMLAMVPAPVKVFGDIHGQLPELLAIFKTFGSPQHYSGDINLARYVFNGDFVDRGMYSLEVVSLLFAVKTLYPDRIFLLRGNHELRSCNGQAQGGSVSFKDECVDRCGAIAGAEIWESVNATFDWLPVAALIQNSVLVMHGGIGAQLADLDQIQQLPRPFSEINHPLLLDILWSDPVGSDHVVGVHASRRGGGIYLFDAQRVESFCKANSIQMIIRSHECVESGYQFFAKGRLITIFSAGNYTAAKRPNDGAMLELCLNHSTGELSCLPKIIKATHLETMVKENWLVAEVGQRRRHQKTLQGQQRQQ